MMVVVAEELMNIEMELVDKLQHKVNHYNKCQHTNLLWDPLLFYIMPTSLKRAHLYAGTIVISIMYTSEAAL